MRSRTARKARAYVRTFVRREDGALILLTLILLIPMIVVGGFAVDLMRYESRRAALQGVTDQAVLAAANLKQALDPADVVIDYFAKAGAAATLSGPPITDPNGTSNLVTANGYIDVDAFFFGRTLGRYTFAGDDVMRATSTSSAIEGVGATEVSLVLDISGSMQLVEPTTGKRRMKLLQDAASGFVSDLLDPAIPNRVSISLVPYSEQVNIGPELYAQFTTDHVHDFSHCIEFPDTAYSRVALDFTRTYDQVMPLQRNDFGKTGQRNRDNPAIDQPTCPRFPAERITPFSQNEAALTAQIAALEPRAGTSIFLGLKWGAALLDPSTRSAIAALPDTVRDPAFVGRPNDYDVSRNSGQTATPKYLILVTDGENSASPRLKAEFIDTLSEINYFARHNLPYAMKYLLNGDPDYDINTYLYDHHTAADGVTWMRQMCDATKAVGIQIYAISVTGDDTTPEAEAGRTEMRNCASDPAKFFKSTGANLNSIFDQIARQITELRLTQ